MRSQFHLSSSRFCYNSVLEVILPFLGSSLEKRARCKLKMHSPLRSDKTENYEMQYAFFRLIYLGASLLNYSTKGKFCDVMMFSA